ncbi:carbamoyltransferase [Sorangium sp. So ce260]|uniref:carbamoyltransferase family protein n=1 Tax=Sorangium sp. So ce260 TaxID=3133291 RepID=UPI003F634817
MKILGISCFYHDSAACLVEDGVIVAAAQEERFTRKKHDAAFPTNAVRYCLAEAGMLEHAQLDAVAFYDKPLVKFHRILETYLSVAPLGLQSFRKAVPLWLRDKLWIDPTIRDGLEKAGVEAPEKLYFPAHHESHAASAYYPSPFPEAAVMNLDGVGEWATATIGVGEGRSLELLQELDFPHSLGLLYSAFTYFTGFRVNSGEYKLMGLAPYGEGKYTKLILEKLLDLKEDGSFRLNMDYFGYLDGLVMTNDRFAALFGGPPHKPETPLTRREMDIAKSVQEVTEEIVIRMARHARKITGKKDLCMAGGVALNCVANGKLLRANVFDDVWIQPAAGDAGGALGAALHVWHNVLGNERKADGRRDSMRGSYLGPEFSAEKTQAFLDARGYPYARLSDEDWAPTIAKLIADEKVIALCHGRMEFGPRALGNRSIIGDARSPKMQSVMNLKIKFRESFRPFAPSCLEEKVGDYFDIDRLSPYMLLVADVKESRRIPLEGDEAGLDIMEWVNRPRSDIPAITHVDYSARIQTVSRETNGRYHALIEAFEKLTGYGVIINTSFNVRGEPIVCTPEDAYRCFMRSEIDYLVLGPFLLKKTDQPRWHERENWRETFNLD